MSMTRSTSRIGSALRAGPANLAPSSTATSSAGRSSAATASDATASATSVAVSPVVTLESVVKRYAKTEALRGFDLTLRRGEVVALPSVV